MGKNNVRQVRRVGGSLVVSLPSAVLAMYKIEENDNIEFNMVDMKQFSIKKVE